MRFLLLTAALFSVACAGSRPAAPAASAGPSSAPAAAETPADLVSAVSAAGLERPNAIDPKEMGGMRAAEVFKNAKVMGDLPAERFMLAMQSMRNSLGTGCDHCHELGKFAADGKAPKQTARVMLTMSLDLNQRFFHGKTRVTCFTCHRGDTVPELPAPPKEPGWWPLPPLSDADAQKPAKAIYKNLKVLGDMPAGRMPDVMQAFSRSLGIKCDHCHEKGNWAADTKDKQIAREMLAMVQSIGETHFAGKKNPVRCATCHHGSEEPARFAGPRLAVKVSVASGGTPNKGMVVLGPSGFSAKDTAALMQLFFTGKGENLEPMMVLHQAEVDLGHQAPGTYSLCSVLFPDDIDPEHGNFGPPAPLDCQDIQVGAEPPVVIIERTLK